jgi:ATP-binding cassette subfamily B protein
MIVLGYTSLTGILALVVPLAAQALVNTVAVGIFLQPLVVLSFAVLMLLLFRGFLRLLNLYLVELIQQRVFMRVSLELAHHLPRIRQEALAGTYPPELANRFFDILTVQKTWAKLLLDGPAALLQSLVGLLLMGFYSPLLLAFDVILVACSAFVLFGLGLGGIRTSIRESSKKYDVAHWLEEVARCEQNLKFTASPEFTVLESDTLVNSYLDARKGHFRVLLRQATGSYLLQAVASAGILAVGGWLVIQRQLTMGQLVASELIVLSVLAALEKVIRLAEPFYDLLTALYKIGNVTDLPREPSGSVSLDSRGQPPRLELHDVSFAYPGGSNILEGLKLILEPGRHLGVTGPSGAGKTTMLNLLAGLSPPKEGTARLAGRSLGEYQIEDLRSTISVVGNRLEVFTSSFEVNLRVGRRDISEAELHRVLELTGLDEDLARMPKGLQTEVLSEGRNLSSGQVQRLLLARSMLGTPSILFLDESLQGLDPLQKQTLLENVIDRKTWTVVLVSQDWEVLRHCDEILFLEEGRIVQNTPLAKTTPETPVRKYLSGTRKDEA